MANVSSGITRTRFATTLGLTLSIGLAGPAVGGAIKVSTTLDNDLAPPDACTLRDAIIAANTDTKTGGCKAGKGADKIKLAKGAIYVLSVAGTDEGDAATGDLDIWGRLTIEGRGSTVAGAGLDRVLDVLPARDPASPTSVTVSSLRITGGDVTAAAGSTRGGGVRVSGATFLGSDLDISGNHAGSSGGGIAGQSVPGEPVSLTLRRSVVEGNTGGEGSGLFFFAFADETDNLLTITDTTIRGNSGDDSGGGVLLGSFTPASELVANIDRTIVSDNDNLFGGGLFLDGQAGAAPGAVTVNVHETTIPGNRSINGGGIQTSAEGVQLNLIQSTVSGNTVTALGAMDQTGVGGGMLITSNNALLANVTVSNNTAIGDPNLTQGAGGGVVVAGITAPAEARLVNTTVAFNDSSLVGGVGTARLSAVGTAETIFENTIVANNSALAPFLGPSCGQLNGGVHTSLGHNIEDHTDGPGPPGLELGCKFTAAGDQNLTDPELDDLADNGGPTFTHALSVTSPGLDAADGATCAAAPVDGVDQRGVKRSKGAGCDVGAYEAE